MRKKVGTILYRIFCLVLVAYSLVIVIYHISCDAAFKYNAAYDVEGIGYNDVLYVDGDVAEPYYLITSEESELSPQKHFVKQILIYDVVFPFKYFEFYNEKYDENQNFILSYHDIDYEETQIFVKENFVYPTLLYNDVDQVWFSLNDEDERKISDKKIVQEIVECAESKGTKALNEITYNALKEKQGDNEYFFLKYKGYPLLEEFYVTENKAKEYVIKQYTQDEYFEFSWNGRIVDGYENDGWY